MEKYVCIQLVDNVCHQWQAYQTSIDMLAITQSERDIIITSTLVLWFAAYAIRQVMNVILRRRY